MIFRSFTFAIIIQEILIVLTIFAFFLSMDIKHFQFTTYGFAGIAVIQVYFLIRTVLNYYKKTNLFLETFIVNETHPAFRNNYVEKPFKKLKNHLDRISESYSVIKSEKEMEHLFLENLVEQIRVGLLVYDEDGSISLVNSTFKEYFNIKSIQHTDQLKHSNGQAYAALISDLTPVPTLVKTFINNELRQLTVKVTGIKIRDDKKRIAIVHDISHELEQEEIESWQKLIRILRHEIINSISPITSLASTLKETFEENNYPEVFNGAHFKNLDNTYQGLLAIENRGKGLMEFVRSYKDISSTLKPQLAYVHSSVILNQVDVLTGAECKEKLIDLRLEVPGQDILLFIDEKQIIQVMLNLVKNAIQAFSRKETVSKSIEVGIRTFGNTNQIFVRDNGEGIPAENLENIFVPFFTTREGGSGIGLSICRQIMQLHKGSIHVNSTPGKTEFVLSFTSASYH